MDVGKIILRDISEDEKKLSEIRGHNIIKINKILTAQKDYGITYHMIIMEKAILRSLNLNIRYLKSYQFGLLFKNSFEETADSFVRFLSRQIINGLETFNRNDYYYIVKPENILMSAQLILKLSNFNNMKKIDENKNGIKKDYFSLGSTLFFLKFSKVFLNENELRLIDSKEKIVDILLEKISKENKYKTIDRDLIYFLVELIKDEKYLTFEQIYKNKWLNKNLDCIDNTLCNFETNEGKLIIEL